MIKFAASINVNGERIKQIDRINNTTSFHIRSTKETSEHALLCDANESL